MKYCYYPNYCKYKCAVWINICVNYRWKINNWIHLGVFLSSPIPIRFHNKIFMTLWLKCKQGEILINHWPMKFLCGIKLVLLLCILTKTFFWLRKNKTKKTDNRRRQFIIWGFESEPFVNFWSPMSLLTMIWHLFFVHRSRRREYLHKFFIKKTFFPLFLSERYEARRLATTGRLLRRTCWATKSATTPANKSATIAACTDPTGESKEGNSHNIYADTVINFYFYGNA